MSYNSSLLRGIASICIFTMSCILAPVKAFSAETAGQVAVKASQLISNSKGLKVSFSIRTGNTSIPGTLASSGTKFHIDMPDSKIWYDGKSLYTMNSRHKETTVVSPTPQELLECNPLLYIKGGTGAYSYAFAKNQPQGKFVIIATPIKINSNIKNLTFTINKVNYHIDKIDIVTSKSVSQLIVNSFNSDIVIPDTEFVYPAKRYNDYEIIDLR